MPAGDAPLLLGPVELADALGVRQTLLGAYFGQPGPTPALAVAVPGEVVRDYGNRPVEILFTDRWQARCVALFLALGRAGVRDGIAAHWAWMCLSGRHGPLPGRAWIRSHRGRISLREVGPDAHETGFVPVDLVGVEGRLADAFDKEALTLADWMSLGSYHDVRLVEHERPALPPEVLAAAADPKGVPKDNRALIASLYGSGKGPRKPRVVVVPGPGERGVDPAEMADALAA